LESLQDLAPPPLVSIITGIYNSSRYIDHYFNMLDQQTFKDWEAILVDDGSRDNTCALIEERVKKDPRIRLIKKQPEGFPSRSRAFGVGHARGRYLAFCDHDDFWAPQKLEFQLAVLRRFSDATIVHTDRFVWTKQDPPASYFHFSGTMSDVPVTRQLPEQVIYKGLQIIFSSFIGPADFIRSVGFHPDMKGVDDFYLFVRLALMGSIYRVDLPLTYYFAHSGNLSHEKNIFVEGFYKVFHTLEADGAPRKVLNSLHAQACRTEAVSLFATDRPRALGLLIKSMRLYFIPSTLNRLAFLLVTFFIPLTIQKRIFKLVKVIKFKVPTFSDLWQKRE
jgi:glycosyltransferase involved in cell wall biosynthesis